jgi:asparagine synthase (glutamine-hydrolysing)
MLKKLKYALEEVKGYASDKLIRKIKKSKLSYLTPAALANIKNVVVQVKINQVPGIFVEAGCALGGSAIVITANKRQSRIFKIYDAFGMIPPPTANDGQDVIDRYQEIKDGESIGIGGDKYYGYEEDLRAKVIENFEKFNIELEKENIELIKGLFENTLNISEPVAFAHVDGDWYSSTMTCLEQIVPNLSPGGIIIIDDYYAWSGCKKAVDEYFGSRQDGYSFQTVAKKLNIQRL